MRLSGISCASLLVAVLVSACGGGGGGGGANGNGGTPGTTVPAPVPAPPANPTGDWLTLTPSTVSLSTYEGESATFSISAKSSRIVEKRFNVGIVDGRGIVSTQLDVTPVTQLEYSATLRTSASLAVGAYTTNLEVRLCEDDPLVCRSPLPGSPWLVPVSLTVRTATNLTALSTIPGVAGWSTYQGNASHTGFVPASFTATAFNRRWNAAVGLDGALNEVAIDNGKVFATRGSRFGAWALVALDEHSGKEAWVVDLGTLHRVNAPAAANGKVYVTSTGHQDTFFWVFDQATGALLAKTSMSSQWETYMAPTVFGDSVYTNSGSYGGLSRFSAGGALTWFTGLPQYDGWTPGVDETMAYAYANGALHALRTADGMPAYTIANPFYQWHGYTGAPIVLGNGLGFTVDSGRLIAFDLATRTVAWSQAISASDQLALAGGVVYSIAANGTTLDARSAADGAPRWVVNLADNQDDRFTSVLLTRSHAFVSSEQRTLAVDLTTRKVVWSTAIGGKLALSDRGVLYATGPNGRVMAINLR